MRARAALLLGLLACGQVLGTEATSAPMNECLVGAACSEAPGAACVLGRCESSRVPSFVLSVTLPATALYAPNMTFLFRSEDFATIQRVTAKCPTLSKRCFVIPRATVYSGGLGLTEETQARLGIPLGPGTRGVPVRVMVIPRWTLGETSYDASDIGLPVAPELASPFIPNDSDPVTGYRVALAPLSYRLAVMPASQMPFRVPTMFLEREVVARTTTKEFLETLVIGQGGTPLDVAQVPDPVLSTEFRDFKGFTTYLRSQQSFLRLTPIVSLSGKKIAVKFPTAQRSNGEAFDPTDLRFTDLVIAPPDGAVGIPTLETPLPPSGRVLDTSYPDLPTAVPVRGTIVKSAGGAVQGVPARLYFESLSVTHFGGFDGKYMTYRTALTTDGEGRFATILPPGRYKVRGEPLGECDAADPSGCYAKFDQDVTLNESRDLSFTVSERTRVQGSAVTFDKRKLGDAEVIFMPALLPPPAQFKDRLPPIAQPRAFHTHANRSGTFVGYLDPGTYDVIVKPTEGTGFPRAMTRVVVKTGEPVPELAPVVVKAPVRISLNLRDAGDNPLERAYLRAFVLDGGVYHEVATAVTDDAPDTAGNATMFLPSGAE